MLNINQRHRRFITLPSSTPAPVWRSLYSPEWTSDRQPRQLSVDFKNFKDYGAGDGIPDAMHIYGNIWIRMTKEVQLWYFDVLCLSGYGKLPGAMNRSERNAAKYEWFRLLKHGVCFNNHSGVDEHADHVRGMNLDKTDPYWEPLILGGNRVEVVGGAEDYAYDYLQWGRKTYRHLPIRAVNVNALPKPAEFLKDRAVCHVATTMRRDRQPGVFPQFNERVVYPIWVKGADHVYVWDKLIGKR